ncbi:MAG: hypothetical protein AAF585_25425 [Verrucomicrobiota bacterium]
MRNPIDSPLGRFFTTSVAFVVTFVVWNSSVQADSYARLDPRTQVLLRQLEAKYKSGMQYLPGYGKAEADESAGLPRVFAPTQPREVYTKYPWKRDIVTTIFWVGEGARPELGDIGNVSSSWDTKWKENYGGNDPYDAEQRTADYRPKSFVPGLNPFYIALPYNDLAGWRTPKPEAKRVIPWHKERYVQHGVTLLRGQWIAVRYKSKICYGQWEDCGPWTTDDWQYVFGDKKQPRHHELNKNKIGLDVSPAIRDFLELRSHQKCDWRFVDLDEVPDGPWKKYGENNPFVKLRKEESQEQATDEEKKRLADERTAKQREERDAYIRQQLTNQP